jgi:putative endonuclease
LTNKSGTLYTGVTNNLERRMYEHKNKLNPGFASKYNLTRLVFFQEFQYVRDAIMTEKRIKGWLRAKKMKLISDFNPEWKDLSADWFRDS